MPSKVKTDCCAPSRAGPVIRSKLGGGTSAGQLRHDDVALAGGLFLMGDSFGEGYAADGEGPVHEVVIDPFRIDATCVTVTQFAAFVEATGYRTDAERYGISAVFVHAAAADRADILGFYGAAWWLAIRGADWRHPCGPHSDAADMPDHPVVQVSHNDALAYCIWAGRDLPTEAEWEYAARGGLASQRYPWGDELVPGGVHQTNIWQGCFPEQNTAEDGYLATAPAKSYAPNDYGLYQMVGNVWEWCADWFDAGYYSRARRNNPCGPNAGVARVMRGGSYLCHASYCNRYRVAARSSNTPDSASGNLGFRTVARSTPATQKEN